MTDRLRPEWAAPRKETWYEHLLPQRVTDTINQSPLVGALSRYMNSPPPDLTLPSERDSKVPMPRAPSWFDDRPVATEALDKFGLLANFIGPGAKLPPPAPKPQGIRAYHGSPHDFDRFDINKIGTGEGAQAYGRGLYFAEAEDVAQSYRNNLSRFREMQWDGAPISDTPRNYNAFRDSMETPEKWRVGKIVDYISSRGGSHDDVLREARHYFDDRKPEWKAAFDEVASRLKTSWKPGRMYEVKINADPETFLDWDKPLSQQSDNVKAALQGIYPDGLPGGDVYQMMLHDAHTSAIAKGNNAGTSMPAVMQRATDDLRSMGVPGIKYLDQGSRAAGQGSRNYVVFDDKLIEILRKYGLLPPVAAGAASLAQGQEPPL